MRAWLAILVVLVGMGSVFSSPISAQLVKGYKCEQQRKHPNFHRIAAIVLKGHGFSHAMNSE